MLKSHGNHYDISVELSLFKTVLILLLKLLWTLKFILKFVDYSLANAIFVIRRLEENTL